MKREEYFASQNFITLIDTFNHYLAEKVKAIKFKYWKNIDQVSKKFKLVNKKLKK